MQATMWTYPWDVQDLGFETVAAELRDRAGLTGVSLAASYHAGRFLQPRSPVRTTYFPEDGTVYFRPDPKRWDGSRLKPRMAAIVERGDVLRQFVEARERTGLAVSAWTVCLHNMRLGTLHPEATVRNAFGESAPFALCPSHPDARAYVTALVEDLTHGYRPDAVELETPGFLPFAHGYHHEKDGVGLTAEDDFLLSLCFCASCLAGAAKAGVDGVRAQATARTLIVESLARAVPAPRWPDFPAAGLDALAGHPALAAYARWRAEPVTSLVAEVRARAHPDSRIYVIDIREGWLGGADAAALGRVSDGMVVCAYDMDAAATADAVAAVRAALGPDRHVSAGFRVFHPEMAGPADLAARAAAARRAGADALNFYNYGLIPAARLDWVRAAVDGAGG